MGEFAGMVWAVQYKRDETLLQEKMANPPMAIDMSSFSNIVSEFS